MKIIDSFHGRHGFLSNFYMCQIVHEGISYASVEHAYQASKTLDLRIREKIKNAPTPSIAKRVGQTLTLRPDWSDDFKIDTMRMLLEKKFSHKHLKQMLLSTNDAKLIEGNYWYDTFWGVYRGVGFNHLGILLMEVRDNIKKETHQ